jgi:hypothetical protein
VAKFLEDDMLKLERLCELHAKYRAQLRSALPEGDEDSGKEDAETLNDTNLNEDKEEEDEELLLAQLDAGAFVLRMVDAVLAELVCGDVRFAQRARQLLTLHDSSPRVIARSVRRLARTLGAEKENGGIGEEVQRDKSHLFDLAKKLVQLG